MKWIIGIVILILHTASRLDSGTLVMTRDSGWGVFLLIVLPLALFGILFYLGAEWWIGLVVGGFASVSWRQDARD